MRRLRLAVIDIGSNTIRSMVAETLPDGGYRVLDDEREVARLASGLHRRGVLSHTAVGRAIRALKRMADIATARGVDGVAVVATSALRNAANRQAFVGRVRRETGLVVRIISGEQEAQLAFESAAHRFDLAGRPCAVADVGGGSTEIILALGAHIQRVYSLHLGAVTLTENHLESDPVRRKEFKAMRAAILRELERARIVAEPAPQFLIASGGTATSIAQVAMSLQGLSGRPVQGFEITQAQLLHLREALLRRSLAERREIAGLSTDRADIILAGVSILYEILVCLKINTLRVSAGGIRDGLLTRLIAQGAGRDASSLVRPRRLAAAAAFARSLNFERKHAEHVQRLALAIFDQLGAPLGCDAGSRDLLSAAALLHDVGYVVGFRQHHKHTYHLIAHAPLDGFTPEEREIIALVARYHRRSAPRKKHKPWAALSRANRVLVCRLSAILRVADALDRRHSQQVLEVRCRLSRGKARLTMSAARDPAVEIHAAGEKADLFRSVFDVDLQIEKARSGHERRRPSAARRAPSLRIVKA